MDTKKAFKTFNYYTQLRWVRERMAEVSSSGKPTFEAAPPPEFKGPEGVWTPEDLFVAAIDICTMTTFLAFASQRHLPLIHYESRAHGILENSNGKFRFTKVILSPQIIVEGEENVALATQILHDAEAHCLISNSISAQVEVQAEIRAAVSAAQTQ